MRDDKTIDRIIVTINDRMNFCCGRKMIEISNQDWRNFVFLIHYGWRGTLMCSAHSALIVCF